MKISVVTVCLNVADTIEKTVESVLNQTYPNLEYIIMDGQSQDGTLEIIRSYERDSRVKVYSGKDSGLYNAMNKSIDVCTGDYILFLNSGDVLVNNTVLEDVVKQINVGITAESQLSSKALQPQVFYGNVIRVSEKKKITERYPGKHVVFKLLMMGKMPCHQGIFSSAEVMKKYRFDESYRICADFDFLLRCVHDKVKMQYADVNVSIVDCVTGISSQDVNLDKMRAEDDRSIKKNYPMMYYVMWIPKRIVRSRKCKIDGE